MILKKAKQLLIASPKAAPDVLSIILFPLQLMTGQVANLAFPCNSAVLWPHLPYLFLLLDSPKELQSPDAEDNPYNISHLVIL